MLKLKASELPFPSSQCSFQHEIKKKSLELKQNKSLLQPEQGERGKETKRQKSTTMYPREHYISSPPSFI